MNELYSLIQSLLIKYGSEVSEKIKANLLGKDKLATGNLYESINYHVKTAGGIVKLTIDAADYLMWVENGRKPGKQPPVLSILRWIRAVGIVPDKPGKKKQSLPKMQKSLAFVIARSIGKKGIKPTAIVEPVLTETYDDFVNNLQIEIAGEMTKGINKEFESIFQNKEVATIKNNLI